MPNLPAFVARVDHDTGSRERTRQEKRQEPARRRFSPKQPQSCERQCAHPLDGKEGELRRLRMPFDQPLRRG
jgi:hypothetical protein